MRRCTNLGFHEVYASAHPLQPSINSRHQSFAPSKLRANQLSDLLLPNNNWWGAVHLRISKSVHRFFDFLVLF